MRPRIPIALSRRAPRKKKARSQNDLAFWLKWFVRGEPPVRDYLAIPVDAGAGATVSFFCAQAPRLSTPAATATIMIILT